MNKSWMRLCKYILVITFSVTLAACGGGETTNTVVTPDAVTPAPVTPVASNLITGTAAAGAPVVGYVSVRDSSANAQPVKTNIPIEANGKYSVDVTGLTAPYSFLARGSVGGKTVEYYSAATSADVGGTINITPFTDLIIRNIAATAVDTYLNNGGLANLTAAQLDAQRVALTTQLAPALTAMGLSGSIDLLRATFNADSTGLDRFMDIVKVDTTVPSAVTITNILDAANTLVIDTTASATTLASSGNVGTAQLSPAATTPFDKMLETGRAFSAFYATNLADPADPNLLALFSTTFMDNGLNRSAWLTQNMIDPVLIGFTFANLGVDYIDTVAGVAQVHVSPMDKAGNNLTGAADGVMHWQMRVDAATGLWQFDGNQRLVELTIRPYAMKGTCNPSSANCTSSALNLVNAPEYQTGIRFDIVNKAMLPIGSVVVTGSGLPAGGVTLVKAINWSGFNITTANATPCDNAVNFMCNLDYWMMTDAEIALVTPNSVYTVKLYDNAVVPVLMATYTEVIPVAPVLNTVKSALSYPSLSGMVDLVGIGAATLTPSWSIPTGQTGGYMWVGGWQPSTGERFGVGTDINAATGTATLAIPAPLAGGVWDGYPYESYSIYSKDQFGRQLITIYQ